MSEELFIRGIVSLFICILVFLALEHRYDEEIEKKSDEDKHQKYLPYISTGFLVGGLLGKVIWGALSDERGFARKYGVRFLLY